jgi:hypothetical protein
MSEVGYLTKVTKLVFTKSVAKLKNINKSPIMRSIFAHLTTDIQVNKILRKKIPEKFLSRHRQVYSKIHIGSHKLTEELKQS